MKENASFPTMSGKTLEIWSKVHGLLKYFKLSLCLFFFFLNGVSFNHVKEKSDLCGYSMRISVVCVCVCVCVLEEGRKAKWVLIK